MKRPDIKDFFPPDTDIPSALKVYKSQPELFNYVKALDSYIDFMSESLTLSQVEEMRKALEWVVNYPDPEDEDDQIRHYHSVKAKCAEAISNIQSLNSK
jgi:hypothetical protein